MKMIELVQTANIIHKNPTIVFGMLYFSYQMLKSDQ